MANEENFAASEKLLEKQEQLKTQFEQVLAGKSQDEIISLLTDNKFVDEVEKVALAIKNNARVAGLFVNTTQQPTVAKDSNLQSKFDNLPGTTNENNDLPLNNLGNGSVNVRSIAEMLQGSPNKLGVFNIKMAEFENVDPARPDLHKKSIFSWTPDLQTPLNTSAGFFGAGADGSLGAFCNTLFTNRIIEAPKGAYNCIYEAIDIIPTDKTNIFWQEEYIDINNARVVRDNVASPGAVPEDLVDNKPESSFGYRPRSTTLKYIAETYRIDERTLRDCSMSIPLIEKHARDHINRKLAQEIMSGTGGPTSLDGVLSYTGVIPVTPGVGGIPALSATYNALDLMKDMQLALADKDCVCRRLIMTAGTYAGLTSIKDTTGRRILGDDCQMKDICCEVCIVSPQFLPHGTIMLIPNDSWKLYVGLDLQLEFGMIHDDFTRNIRRMRAEMSAASVHERPWCTYRISGMPFRALP